jgi:hypothetical protein
VEFFSEAKVSNDDIDISEKLPLLLDLFEFGLIIEYNILLHIFEVD